MAAVVGCAPLPMAAVNHGARHAARPAREADGWLGEAARVGGVENQQEGTLHDDGEAIAAAQPRGRPPLASAQGDDRPTEHIGNIGAGIHQEQRAQSLDLAGHPVVGEPPAPVSRHRPGGRDERVDGPPGGGLPAEGSHVSLAPGPAGEAQCPADGHAAHRPGRQRPGEPRLVVLEVILRHPGSIAGLGEVHLPAAPLGAQ